MNVITLDFANDMIEDSESDEEADYKKPKKKIAETKN